MTPKAEAFIKANESSPVVSGAVIGSGGKGARYTLANGQRFKLTSEECKQIGMPRWQGVGA